MWLRSLSSLLLRLRRISHFTTICVILLLLLSTSHADTSVSSSTGGASSPPPFNISNAPFTYQLVLLYSFDIPHTTDWLSESLSAFTVGVNAINRDRSTYPLFQFSPIYEDPAYTMAGALAGAIDANTKYGSNMLGYIGTGYTSELTGAALYSSFIRKPIVSPGSTSPDFVDKSQFPYLLRSIPNDADQVVALAYFLAKMNYLNIAVILSPTIGGESATYRIFAAACADLRISIRTQAYVTQDTTSASGVSTDPEAAAARLATFESVLTNVKASGCRIIVMLTISTEATMVQTAAVAVGMDGSDYVWLGLTQAVVDGTAPFEGMFYVQPFSSLSNASTQALQQLGQIWKNSTVHDSKELYLWDNGDGLPDYWSVYVYDTVLLYAKAIQSLLSAGQNPLDGTLMREALKNVTFSGASGYLHISASTGDRSSNFRIYNMQRINSTDPVTGVSKSVVTSVAVAEYDPSTDSSVDVYFLTAAGTPTKNLNDIQLQFGKGVPYSPSDGSTSDGLRSIATRSFDVSGVDLSDVNHYIQLAVKDSFDRFTSLSSSASATPVATYLYLNRLFSISLVRCGAVINGAVKEFRVCIDKLDPLSSNTWTPVSDITASGSSAAYSAWIVADLGSVLNTNSTMNANVSSSMTGSAVTLVNSTFKSLDDAHFTAFNNLNITTFLQTHSLQCSSSTSPCPMLIAHLPVLGSYHIRLLIGNSEMINSPVTITIASNLPGAVDTSDSNDCPYPSEDSETAFNVNYLITFIFITTLLMMLATLYLSRKRLNPEQLTISMQIRNDFEFNRRDALMFLWLFFETIQIVALAFPRSTNYGIKDTARDSTSSVTQLVKPLIVYINAVMLNFDSVLKSIFIRLFLLFFVVAVVWIGMMLAVMNRKFEQSPSCHTVIVVFQTIAPLVGRLGFIPILRSFYSTLACVHQFPQSGPFMESNCSISCWTGVHIGYAIMALIGILCFYPLAVHTSSLWQNAQERGKIRYSMAYCTLMANTKLGLLIIQSFLSTYPVAYITCYGILIYLAFGTMLLVVKQPFNMHKLNQYTKLCLLYPIWTHGVTVFILLVPNSISSLGLLILLVVGYSAITTALLVLECALLPHAFRVSDKHQEKLSKFSSIFQKSTRSLDDKAGKKETASGDGAVAPLPQTMKDKEMEDKSKERAMLNEGGKVAPTNATNSASDSTDSEPSATPALQPAQVMLHIHDSPLSMPSLPAPASPQARAASSSSVADPASPLEIPSASPPSPPPVPMYLPASAVAHPGGTVVEDDATEVPRTELTMRLSSLLERLDKLTAKTRKVKIVAQ